MVEGNWSMQAEHGVFRKDPSNTRRSFFPSLHAKTFGVRCKSGKNISSQHGNATTHLLRSSLFRVVSNLVVCLETEE